MVFSVDSLCTVLLLSIHARQPYVYAYHVQLNLNSLHLLLASWSLTNSSDRSVMQWCCFCDRLDCRVNVCVCVCVFLSAGNASDLEHQLKDIKMLVNAGVPSGHLTVLKYLCGHLHRCE